MNARSKLLRTGILALGLAVVLVLVLAGLYWPFQPAVQTVAFAVAVPRRSEVRGAHEAGVPGSDGGCAYCAYAAFMASAGDWSLGA